ncbi:unnamed protein product [Microthlaspi erraticum]|uniref:Uncharacterized protein n=1 Tax=Microthlaspi erraticum TaxID=1685480 RepID=A0A6D2IDP6_9BRAS|nr:unnamed protein product [Microthlaspi erraticum]
MTLSKRLALLGVRSAVSTSRSRGVGSSYALMDRRPFPYRQISTFTNHSKNSEMETLEDDSSPQLIKSIETEFKSNMSKLHVQWEKNRKLLDELDELRMMESDLLRYVTSFLILYGHYLIVL